MSLVPLSLVESGCALQLPSSLLSSRATGSVLWGSFLFQWQGAHLAADWFPNLCPACGNWGSHGPLSVFNCVRFSCSWQGFCWYVFPKNVLDFQWILLEFCAPKAASVMSFEAAISTTLWAFHSALKSWEALFQLRSSMGRCCLVSCWNLVMGSCSHTADPDFILLLRPFLPWELFKSTQVLNQQDLALKQYSSVHLAYLRPRAVYFLNTSLLHMTKLFLVISFNLAYVYFLSLNKHLF